MRDGLQDPYPPEVRVLKYVLVLQELHVVVPDPLGDRRRLKNKETVTGLTDK